MNDNSNDTGTNVQNLSGGAVRVSFGAPPADAEAATAPPAFRTGNESYRWTAGGGMEKSGVTRFAHNPAGEVGGDIMASRQRLNGHDTVCYEPGNESTRVQLAFALKEGLVREVAPGVYEDARRAPAVQVPSHQAAQPAQLPGQQLPAEMNQPQEVPPELQGVFNAEEDAAWRAEFAEVPDHAFNAAMAGVVKAVTLGHNLESAAASLARDTGMDLAEAAEKVENGLWAQRQIVDRALTNIGMPAEALDAFYESTRGNVNKLQDAIFRLLHGRDVGPFQAWGREWMSKRGAA